MTNEHYLEVAKECGFGTVTIYSEENKEIVLHTSTPERLAAYTTRICAEKDAEIEHWKNAAYQADRMRMEQAQKLSEANAAIAMKDAALKDLSIAYEAQGKVLPKYVGRALSTSPESIAAWEAEKQAKWNEESNSLIGQLEIEVLSLQRRVAMLWQLLDESWQEKYLNGIELRERCNHALANTQATAEAYDIEHAVKVLEEAAKWFDYGELNGRTASSHLNRMAAELRATKQVKENG